VPVSVVKQATMDADVIQSWLLKIWVIRNESVLDTGDKIWGNDHFMLLFGQILVTV
jgi:hypothetical protein